MTCVRSILRYNPATMPKRKAQPRKSPRAKSHRKAAFGRKLPKNAVTLIVILRPREGQEILLEAELRALIGPTRKEEGCISYELHRALEPPGGFLLHEVWARRAHRTHAFAAFPALERRQGRAPCFPRRHLLAANRLRLGVNSLGCFYSWYAEVRLLNLL